MCVHQPEHLADRRLPVRKNRPHQEFANQGIECGLVSLRVSTASIEGLFIEGKSDVLHAIMITPHIPCVHSNRVILGQTDKNHYDS